MYDVDIVSNFLFVVLDIWSWLDMKGRGNISELLTILFWSNENECSVLENDWSAFTRINSNHKKCWSWIFFSLSENVSEIWTLINFVLPQQNPNAFLNCKGKKKFQNFKLSLWFAIILMKIYNSFKFHMPFFMSFMDFNWLPLSCLSAEHFEILWL